MPIVNVYPPNASVDNQASNPLPEVLHTPSGLAIVEIQGTVHTEDASDIDDSQEARVGNLIFPGYNPQTPEDTAWMKKVYLYVGKHQRMTGQVKKLPKALAILQRKEAESNDLQITEIIKYKIVFSQRPEPVGEE